MDTQAGELFEYDNRLGEVALGIQHSLSKWFQACTHPGGFAWEVATEQLPPKIAVWRTSNRVAGWAAFSEEDARIECAPGDASTTEILTQWLLDTAGEAPVSVAVHQGQTHLRNILSTHGFTDEATPLPGVSHPARDTGVRPPAGYRIRPMEEGEDSVRIQAHRRAWKPAELPFTDDTLDSIDQEAESRFDANRLTTMQNAWLYDRDLDLVIEAPDGSLAGSCTVWLDPTSGWAELEPLGIVPEHRRRGLAQALALDVCRRVASHGGSHVFINSAPLTYYRAPWDAYLKAGFTPMHRGSRMSRSLA